MSKEAPATELREQEPVAYIHRQGNHYEVSERFLSDDEKSRGWTEEPLYTSPPTLSLAQRQARSADTWVGLTEEEKELIVGMFCKKDSSHDDAERVAKAIEAKLKEKNT